MDIVLSYNNMAEVLTLPFLPSEINLPGVQMTNEEFDLSSGYNGIGKLNLSGLRGLKVLTIESFFATKKYSFAKKQKDGWACVNLINKWSKSRRPIRVIITNDKHLEILNMACLIESFVYRVDRAGDIPYTLDLKEFVMPVVVK